DSFAYPDFIDIREGVPALDAAAAYRLETLALSRGGEGERVNAIFVSPEYFRVLGLMPTAGRFLTPEEDRGVGEHPVAVLGHGFWRDRMGAAPDVVGATIQLNRRPYTVVGIGPADFRGHMIGYVPDVYLPIVQHPPMSEGRDYLDQRGASWHQTLGLLRPGGTVDELNAQLTGLGARLAEAHPATNANRTFSALPLGPIPGGGRGPASLFLGVLMGLVGLILVVTCANVAGMFLGRAAAREREVAVRLALGAGRGALLRQLTVEALLVFVLGGAVGAALAVFGVGLLRPDLVPTPVPIDFDVSPDGRVFAFAAAVTLVTGLVFGLLPALQATRLDLVRSLREDVRSGGGRSWVRRAFVTAQVGFSLVLLMAAGLFVRSLQQASELETGFDPSDTYMAGVDLSLEGYDAEEGRGFQQMLLDRIRELPGVSAAALAMDFPLDMSSNGTVVRPEGRPEEERGVPVDFNRVSPGYFGTLRIPLLQGRDFSVADDAGSEAVAVVSRVFAERVWPGEEPLGRAFRWGLGGEAPLLTVVGVVEDVKNSLITEAAKPFVYLPLSQSYDPGAHVVVRAGGGITAVAPSLRRAILEADPSLSFTPVIALESYTRLGILPQRVAAGVTATLGLLALLLAGLGVYGVVAHAVGQRTREMGVRMALGADRSDLLRLLVRGGIALALPGVVVGALLSVGVGSVMQSLLLGLSPADPWALGTVALLLVGVVVLASFVPARRAAGVPPMEALRHE
ncbi:MAG: ABC transporter permease, partial [Gemmatimonadetes bacterium]|nr:ABC transporter permease [Gemmatimonadota bacterium]